MNQVQVITEDSLSLITKAEIDMQISTAKAFPRSLKQSIDKATSVATISQDVAESCVYAIPRGGKTLEGPSVRLAEIVASSFGNIRTGARVIANDGKTITAQGICHDLETNNCVTVEVKKSILQNEYQNGQRTGKMITMSEDMQVVTGNAACAIAFRNVVFKVIPAALIETVYETVKLVAKGSAQTLEERKTKAIDWLHNEGVKDEQICSVLAVKKVADIDLEKLSVLSGYRTAVKNGDITLSEIFAPAQTKPKLTKTDMEAAKNEILKGNATVESISTLFELEQVQVDELKSAKNGN